MMTVIFRDKWSSLYHMVLASVSDDGESRCLGSRYARAAIGCTWAVTAG